MCPSAPRVCSEPGGQRPVLSLSLDLINNIPSLVQIMAWRRPGDKPLSEPMMISSLTHICVPRPQWVKVSNANSSFSKIQPIVCKTVVMVFMPQCITRHGHALNTFTRREIGPCSRGGAVSWCISIRLCQGKTFEAIKIGNSSKHRWCHVENVTVNNLVVGGATVLFWKQIRKYIISKFIFLQNKECTANVTCSQIQLFPERIYIPHIPQNEHTFSFSILLSWFGTWWCSSYPPGWPLTAKSCEVSKPRDCMLWWPYRSELTCISAAPLPRWLSNLRANGKV